MITIASLLSPNPESLLSVLGSCFWQPQSNRTQTQIRIWAKKVSKNEGKVNHAVHAYGSKGDFPNRLYILILTLVDNKPEDLIRERK
jgi:hypothetical protein